MNDGLFGDGQFGQFMANPMTQLGIALLAAPRRDAQGRGTGFGQQLGSAMGTSMDWRRAIAQMQYQQFQQQQAQRQAQEAEKRAQAQEQFRTRAPEYMREGELDPRAAVRIGMETGALSPQEALQQAGKLRRYIPVGGNRLFDTETNEYIEGPPQPVKLGTGQMLLTPNEQGGYEQKAFNPRQFAPTSSTGRGGGLGKPPSGYRWTAEGSLEPIPGGPAAFKVSKEAVAGIPKLRESEAKAATYFSQMRAASQTIDDLEQQGVDPTSLLTQMSTRIAGTAANPLASPEGQQLKQAQEQWAEAYLRFKTGAATNPSEIERNVRTFFPQIGDGPEIKQQKAIARRQAEQDISLAAGAGARSPAPPAGRTPQAANPGTPAILQRVMPSVGAQDAGEAWIKRAMQANPGMSREQIIEEGKRRGKLR